MALGYLRFLASIGFVESASATGAGFRALNASDPIILAIGAVCVVLSCFAALDTVDHVAIIPAPSQLVNNKKVLVLRYLMYVWRPDPSVPIPEQILTQLHVWV